MLLRQRGELRGGVRFAPAGDGAVRRPLRRQRQRLFEVGLQRRNRHQPVGTGIDAIFGQGAAEQLPRRGHAQRAGHGDKTGRVGQRNVQHRAPALRALVQQRAQGGLAHQQRTRHVGQQRGGRLRGIDQPCLGLEGEIMPRQLPLRPRITDDEHGAEVGMARGQTAPVQPQPLERCGAERCEQQIALLQLFVQRRLAFGGFQIELAHRHCHVHGAVERGRHLRHRIAAGRLDFQHLGAQRAQAGSGGRARQVERQSDDAYATQRLVISGMTGVETCGVRHGLQGWLNRGCCRAYAATPGDRVCSVAPDAPLPAPGSSAATRPAFRAVGGWPRSRGTGLAPAVRTAAASQPAAPPLPGALAPAESPAHRRCAPLWPVSPERRSPTRGPVHIAKPRARASCTSAPPKAICRGAAMRRLPTWRVWNAPWRSCHRLRGDVERAQPQRCIKHIADQHEFVRLRRLGQRGKALPYRLGAADDGGSEKVLNRGALLRVKLFQIVRHRRRQSAALPGENAQHALIGAAGEKLRLFVGWRGDQGHADDDVGTRQRGRRPELLPIQLQRLMQQARREVRGEGIRQPPLRRKPRRKQAGAQQPDGHLCSRTGHGDQTLTGLGRSEQMLQLGHIARKVFFALDAVAAQGAHGQRIGARRASKTQVDAPRIQLGEGAKGFGHDQRRVIGQHDAPRPHADALRAADHITHQHRRGRTGHASQIVMFGQPVPFESQCFGMLRGAQGDLQRLGYGAVFAHGDKIEQR